MYVLDSATKILTITASAACDVTVSGFRDAVNPPSFSYQTKIGAGETKTVCPAGSAAAPRCIDNISITNTGAANTISVKQDDTGSPDVATILSSMVLAASEKGQYTHASGWDTIDANAAKKSTQVGVAVASGKTLTVSNTLTLTATDGSTLAIGTGGTLGTAAYTATTAYEASGGIATHAALQTGVHGISITAGKTLTASNTLTLTATDGSTLAIGTGGTLAGMAYQSGSWASPGAAIGTGTPVAITASSLSTGSGAISGGAISGTTLALGTTPATTGYVRLPADGSIFTRRSDNLADRQLFLSMQSSVSGVDFVQIGSSATAALADDATADLGALQTGIIVIADNSADATALFILNASVPTILSDASSKFAATDSDGFNCLYNSAGNLILKNRMGGNRAYYITHMK